MGYPAEVQGSVSGLGSELHLWAIVVPTRAPAYHPQNGKILVAADGSWSASCYFGTPKQGLNEEYRLLIVAATQGASASLSDYLATANRTHEYPGLPDLPDGVALLKTITVTRI